MDGATPTAHTLLSEIFGFDAFRPLQEKARVRLRQLNLRNVHFKHADGGFGWSTGGRSDHPGRRADACGGTSPRDR